MKKRLIFIFLSFTLCFSLCAASYASDKSINTTASVNAETVFSVKGDADGDNILTAKDVILYKLYLAGRAADANVSDLDGDGVISTADAKTLAETVSLDKPRKYVTMSFDDGITQDEKIIEILKKYNLADCTFFINTGLYGANWDWVAQALNKPGLTHIRYEEDQIASVYEGFDLQSHTLEHPALDTISASDVTHQVGTDAQNIAKITGVMPTGLAWPGGTYSDSAIQTVLSTTSIRFARTVQSTGTFALPEYFMTWHPTVSAGTQHSVNITNSFIEQTATEDMLLYFWGHGYELDYNDNGWEYFEECIKLLTQAAAEDDSIVFVTNAEFYEIFKDKIPSWKE